MNRLQKNIGRKLKENKMEVKIYNKPSEKGMAVREKVFIKADRV